MGTSGKNPSGCGSCRTALTQTFRMLARLEKRTRHWFAANTAEPQRSYFHLSPRNMLIVFSHTGLAGTPKRIELNGGVCVCVSDRINRYENYCLRDSERRRLDAFKCVWIVAFNLDCRRNGCQKTNVRKLIQQVLGVIGPRPSMPPSPFLPRDRFLAKYRRVHPSPFRSSRTAFECNRTGFSTTIQMGLRRSYVVACRESVKRPPRTLVSSTKRTNFPFYRYKTNGSVAFVYNTWLVYKTGKYDFRKILFDQWTRNINGLR